MIVFDSNNLTLCQCGSPSLTIEQWNLTQYRVPSFVLVSCPRCGKRSNARYWQTVTEDWNELTNVQIIDHEIIAE